MKHYVLVHGAWGGAWEFEEMVTLLSTDDSNVLAVDLPGHGDNKAPISEITMAAYIHKVTEVINGLDAKVILVGHSLAGSNYFLRLLKLFQRRLTDLSTLQLLFQRLVIPFWD